VADRRIVLRTIFDVRNPMKVGCRPLFERETRVTASSERRRR
jgi:hypothetical protein